MPPRPGPHRGRVFGVAPVVVGSARYAEPVDIARDDDALSWAGDDDPTLAAAAPVTGRSVSPALGGDDVPAATGPSPAGPTPTGPSPTEELDELDDRAAQSQASGMSSAALVTLGVLGGVYLLYTIGWIVGGLRLQDVVGFLGVEPAASVPAIFVASAAPAIWFAAATLLTRGRAAWQRFAWLAAGAVLLVPWPFAMIGTGL